MLLAATIPLGATVFGGCGEATPHTLATHLPTSTSTASAITHRANSYTGSTKSRPKQLSASASPDTPMSPARMLGQMIVARFSGLQPSSAFLARVRAGQVGGVILFADNLVDPQATRTLTGELQRAAVAGGNPPLLIATDQEGGSVRRLSWAPPTLAAEAMRSSTVARNEGEAAGRALRSVGINLDLAPVADVLHEPQSFLGTRTFGSDPLVVGARACAFASGLTAAGVGFTLKHFPGLGRAPADTDTQAVTVDSSAIALRGDYRAYRGCGAQPNALVMVSNAAYPSLTDSSLPAVLSPEIYSHELPAAIGGTPITISDDLQTPGILDQPRPAQHAIDAGLDLLMYAKTEAGSEIAYSQLRQEVHAGSISSTRIAQASEAIELFKNVLTGESRPSISKIESSEVEATPQAVSTNPGTPTTLKP